MRQEMKMMGIAKMTFGKGKSIQQNEITQQEINEQIEIFKKKGGEIKKLKERATKIPKRLRPQTIKTLLSNIQWLIKNLKDMGDVEYRYRFGRGTKPKGLTLEQKKCIERIERRILNCK